MVHTSFTSRVQHCTKKTSNEAQNNCRQTDRRFGREPVLDVHLPVQYLHITGSVKPHRVWDLGFVSTEHVVTAFMDLRNATIIEKKSSSRKS